MGVVLTGLGISFYYLNESSTAQILCVIFILVFVILFEFSSGPVTWIYLAEIMTDKGLSVALLLNQIFTLTVAIVVPYVISGALFLVFGGLCFVVNFFLWSI